jgi:hypothetical protein
VRLEALLAPQTLQILPSPNALAPYAIIRRVENQQGACAMDDKASPADLAAPAEIGPLTAVGVPPLATAAGRRELERARRAEAARIAALVQYMLHGRGGAGGEDASARH